MAVLPPRHGFGQSRPAVSDGPARSGPLSMGIDASSAAKNTMASFSPPSTNTPPTENYVPTPYPDGARRFRPRHGSRTRKSGQEMLIHCVQARRQERLIHRKSVKGRPVPPKRFTMIAALKISALGVVTRKGARQESRRERPIKPVEARPLVWRPPGPGSYLRLARAGGASLGSTAGTVAACLTAGCLRSFRSGALGHNEADRSERA